MEVLLALASGVLYAAGVYLMLRRRLAQLIIGLGLLSNGTNLLIFTAGGLTRARPPVACISSTNLGTIGLASGLKSTRSGPNSSSNCACRAILMGRPTYPLAS